MNNFLPEKIHESWKEFLTESKIKELERIFNLLNNSNYTPQYNNVLRFFTLDLNKIKVVVVGMEPYPQEGIATGRSFEINGLNSWTQKFKQTSMRNLVRLLYKSSENISEYEEIPKFTLLRDKISTGEFKILNPPELIKSWETQGVLMLNKTFTCEIGKPDQHEKIWKDFSDELFSFIDFKNKDIKWFLWGNHANKIKPLINYGTIYSSRHPMMCSSKYENDFLKSKCFEDTLDIINWLGDSK